MAILAMELALASGQCRDGPEARRYDIGWKPMLPERYQGSGEQFRVEVGR